MHLVEQLGIEQCVKKMRAGLTVHKTGDYELRSERGADNMSTGAEANYELLTHTTVLCCATIS